MIPQIPPLHNTIVGARGPGWSLARARHRACPVCGVDEPEGIVKRPDGFAVHRCRPCGMIYLAEIPAQEEMDGLYQRYGNFKGYAPGRVAGWRLKLKLAMYGHPFIEILEATGGIRQQRVCEIGCAYGDFLRRIACKGGHPTGVELDRAAREYLGAAGIPVETELGTGRKYDIVCLLQVLEHLAEPGAMAAAISNALEQDGRVLISVPNGGDYAKSGPNWVGFRVDLEHLNYFEVRSLGSLLAGAGLYIEHYWEHDQPCLKRQGQEVTAAAAGWRRWRRLLTGCGPGPVAEQGSFVLTVLARKA